MSSEFNYSELEIIRKLDEITKTLRNKKVSFDIDGVEVFSAEKAILNFNLTFDTNYVVDDLTTYWRIIDLVAKADPSIKNPKQFAIDLWNNDFVFGTSEPVSGAWLLSSYLDQHGIKSNRITMRPSFAKQVTLDWYEAKMPWVDPKSIFIQVGDTHDKNFKINTIKKLGIDIHFEDSVEEAEAIVAKTKAKVVLVPHPWNRDYVNPKPGILIPSLNFNRQAPKMVAVYLDLFGRI